MNSGYIKWKNNDLSFISDEGCFKFEAGKVRSQDIGYIKFKVDTYWQVGLLTDNGTSIELWFSQDGKTWEIIEKDPNNSMFDVETDEYILYPHLNAFGILRKNSYCLFIDGKWTETEIPDGVKWIDIEPDMSLCAVGSKPATRIRNSDTELACWRKENVSSTWKEELIQLSSWWQGCSTVKNGGFGKLCFADTRTTPYVFASECMWFLDDPSSFVFLKLPDGRLHSHRLSGKSLYSVDRDKKGNPMITALNYSEGKMLTWTGKKWKSTDLTKTIKSYLKKEGHVFDDSLNFLFTVCDKTVCAVGKVYRYEVPVEDIFLQSDNSGKDWYVKSVENDKDSIIMYPFIVPGM